MTHFRCGLRPHFPSFPSTALARLPSSQDSHTIKTLISMSILRDSLLISELSLRHRARFDSLVNVFRTKSGTFVNGMAGNKQYGPFSKLRALPTICKAPTFSFFLFLPPPSPF